MNCADAQDLVDAYFDAELDLVRSLEIERHVQHCPSCAEILRRHRSLRDQMQSSNELYHRAPESLRQAIISSKPINGQALYQPAKDRAGKPIALFRWGVGLAAAIVATATLTWYFATAGAFEAPQNAVVQELISDHVRSLLADHLTDVVSSDQHTVKPWFTGKLDFSPPRVQDLAESGYTLAGGRLDYVQNRPAAALVYRHGKHIINVFVWPASDKSTAPGPAATQQRGYNLLNWTSQGMNWWIVSDAAAADLQRLADLLRQPAAGAASEPEK